MYVLRLYDEGNGVIVYAERKTLLTHYFRLDDKLWQRIDRMIHQAAAHIIATPHYSGEDDRQTMPVHLSYNLIRFEPYAYEKLEPGMRYEETEFAYDENALKIFTMLLESEDVRSKWLRLHR